MKGTFCGRRAGALVFIVSLISVAVPAAALADGSVGLPVPAVASTPTAPAVPSLPAIAQAVPAVSAPAAPATPVAVAAQATAPVRQAVAHVRTAVTRTTTPAKAAVKSAVRSAVARPASSAAKPLVKPVASTILPIASTDPTVSTGSPRINVKVHTPHGRVLAWSNTGGGGGMVPGCPQPSTWIVCFQIPDYPFVTDNQCNDEPVTLTGTYTFWMRTAMNAFGTVTTDTRQYWVNFHGTGGFGNVYTGNDVQLDYSKTRPITIGTTYSEDHREYQTLIVNHGNAPNMYFYFHSVTRVHVGLDGLPVVDADVYGPFIVCKSNECHSKDVNRGDHDDRDDQYEHREQSFHGYDRD